MKSQDFSIMVGQDDFVETQLIVPSEMNVLKTDLERIENSRIKGIVRTFKSEDDDIILEFYNEVGMKLSSGDDVERLNKIDFRRIENNKVGYSNQITETEFEKMLVGAEKVKLPAVTEVFGTFYETKNPKTILFAGSRIPLRGPAVLSDLSGWDFELDEYLERAPKDDSFSRNPKLKENRDDKVFEITQGKQDNLDLLVSELCELLNIDQELIDFSIESLDVMENALQWNIRNYHQDYMMSLCAYYLSEMLVRNEGFEYKEVNDYFGKKTYDLRYKGETTMLYVYLHDTFVEHPFPQLKPDYLNTIGDLKGY